MGEYTEICLAVELKSTLPKEVSDVLEFLTNRKNPVPGWLPPHDFFKCDRWRNVMCGGSAYFPSPPMSNFSKDNYSSITLSFRANLKDYDSEIEKFCDWIAPYVDPSQGFAGFKQYQGEPTLIYFNDGEVHFRHLEPIAD